LQNVPKVDQKYLDGGGNQAQAHNKQLMNVNEEEASHQKASTITMNQEDAAIENGAAGPSERAASRQQEDPLDQ